MYLLQSIDTQAFLTLNGIHSPFFDFIMYWLSDKMIWFHMYILFIFLIIYYYRYKGLIILLGVGIVVLISDQLASGLLKELVHRLRPSHEPSLAGMIHINGGPGGLYGFASSHAANVFGMATFLWLTLKPWLNWMRYWLVIWAFLVSYSRIYNGVHYPGDVIVGILIGIIVGWTIARLYWFLNTKFKRTFEWEPSD
ncbi:MAG TPA: phosphatase PAP2 family protein [Bacteroidales bacterium]|nr:phosphatase PAP2 family protein [Bacteroidales bacterium]